MDFAQALKALRNGDKLARKTWGDKRYIYIIQNRDAAGKPTTAYIAVWYPEIDGTPAGWVPAAGDLLATDWKGV